MFQGFYITTEDCEALPTAPGEWGGVIKKNTPLVLTYFDEYIMEFIAKLDDMAVKEFSLHKPCPIEPACSCDICGKIVSTKDLNDHKQNNENCRRVSNSWLTKKKGKYESDY